jgi:serine/threonine protein kinase
MSASISVILVVAPGACDPRPAITSVQNQSVLEWELIIIDCCGDEERHAQFHQLCLVDSRISLVSVGGEYAASGALNAGILRATGFAIVYILPNEIFYPRYFEAVRRHVSECDVLASAYDCCWEDGADLVDFVTYDPSAERSLLFMRCPLATLGVAHRRDLWRRLGGYNELLWQNEVWDFLKRAARSGAGFRYVPYRSGARREDVVLGERSCPTKPQRAGIESNFRAGISPFESPCVIRKKLPNRRLLCVSAGPFVNITDADAIAVAAILSLLAPSDFTCELMTIGSGEPPVGSDIRCRAFSPESASGSHEGAVDVRTFSVEVGDSLITWRVVDAKAGDPSRAAHVSSFATFYEAYLEDYKPDILLYFGHEPGSDPIAEVMIRLPKRRDVPVVFLLTDYHLDDPWSLQDVDYCVVPWESMRQHYWTVLGLACEVLTSAAKPTNPLQLTAVPENLGVTAPSDDAGRLFVEQLYKRLRRDRPDIPLQVFDPTADSWSAGPGNGDSNWVPQGVRVRLDRRDFLATSRLIVVPAPLGSLTSMVATQAVDQGIPLLVWVSGRRPESVDAEDLVLGGRLHPRDCAGQVANDADLECWLGAIVRGYDSRSRAAEPAACARARCGTERADHRCTKFFVDAHPQPGPPIVPLAHKSGEVDSAAETHAGNVDIAHDAERPPASRPARDRVSTYRIVREIGRGAMGVVFEAIDERCGASVALKVIRPSRESSSSYRESFLREARISTGLRHPNIVSVLGAGEDDGILYYTMTLLEGITLLQVLERLRGLLTSDGSAALSECVPLPGDETAVMMAKWLLSAHDENTLITTSGWGSSAVQQEAGAHRSVPGYQWPLSEVTVYARNVVRLLLPVAEAMAYAHSQGILHRDLKPANILVAENYTALVSDFGLAKSDDDPRDSALVGEVKYAAPERWRGSGDARTDIHGFGMTLYDFAFPFACRCRLPGDFETIMLRCVSPDPERRYRKMTQLCDDLRLFIADQPISCLEPGYRSPRPAERPEVSLFDLAPKRGGPEPTFVATISDSCSPGGPILCGHMRRDFPFRLRQAKIR